MVSKMRFGPNEAGSVDVTTRLGVMGLNEQQVKIATSASPTPILLTLRAEYRPRARAIAMPASVYLAGKQDSAVVDVDVLALSPGAAEVDRISSDSGLATGKIAKASEDRGLTGGGYHRSAVQLAVTLADPATAVRSGERHDVLVVTFKSPVIPALRIPVELRRLP
jgi:hypothetical protein